MMYVHSLTFEVCFHVHLLKGDNFSVHSLCFFCFFCVFCGITTSLKANRLLWEYTFQWRRTPAINFLKLTMLVANPYQTYYYSDYFDMSWNPTILHPLFHISSLHYSSSPVNFHPSFFRLPSSPLILPSLISHHCQLLFWRLLVEGLQVKT